MNHPPLRGLPGNPKNRYHSSQLGDHQGNPARHENNLRGHQGSRPSHASAEPLEATSAYGHSPPVLSFYPHAPQDNGGARSWIPSLGGPRSIQPPILSLE